MKTIELTEADFDISKKIIKRNNLKNINLLLIYVDWCGHCKRFKPIYEETSKTIGSTINMYKIDGDLCPNVAKMYNIRGYPSILMLDDKGKMISDYKGPRDTKMSFMQNICKMSMNCPKLQ